LERLSTSGSRSEFGASKSSKKHFGTEIPANCNFTSSADGVFPTADELAMVIHARYRGCSASQVPSCLAGCLVSGPEGHPFIWASTLRTDRSVVFFGSVSNPPPPREASGIPAVTAKFLLKKTKKKQKNRQHPYFRLGRAEVAALLVDRTCDFAYAATTTSFFFPHNPRVLACLFGTINDNSVAGKRADDAQDTSCPVRGGWLASFAPDSLAEITSRF
jgi:hypothetical protein